MMHVATVVVSTGSKMAAKHVALAAQSMTANLVRNRALAGGNVLGAGHNAGAHGLHLPHGVTCGSNGSHAVRIAA